MDFKVSLRLVSRPGLIYMRYLQDSRLYGPDEDTLQLLHYALKYRQKVLCNQVARQFIGISLPEAYPVLRDRNTIIWVRSSTFILINVFNEGVVLYRERWVDIQRGTITVGLTPAIHVVNSLAVSQRQHRESLSVGYRSNDIAT